MKGHNLLTECRALITGAGTGIGRAIARALAREGARLAVTDLDDERARSVGQHTQENGRSKHDRDSIRHD